MSKPTMFEIYRILNVLQVMQDGQTACIDQDAATKKMLEADTKRIRDRFEELKPRYGDADAMMIAKAEYTEWVFAGCPVPPEEK